MNEVLLFSNVSVKHDSKKQNHKKKATDQFFQVKVLKTLAAVLRAHCSLDLDQLLQLC